MKHNDFIGMAISGLFSPHHCTEISVQYRYSAQFSPIQPKYANLLI